ncbi:MAG: nitronate monooxygenase, partial [Gammaproteobacteria bacterium]|nr:nitronate monooxygenase [Gammaproteobacteria bacterium]
PCAMLSLAAMRAELEAIRAGCDKPYNVNFFCHTPPLADEGREAGWRAELAPYYAEFGIDADAITAGARRDPFSAEALEVLQEFRPSVVSFHFGLPSAELLAGVKAMGSRVFCSATTVTEAIWLEQQGIDAIIAQGVEAGGHRGMFLSDDITEQVGTFALLPQIVQAVKLPVIAAGGISDADGVAAAIGLGAAAAQIGTSYLLCDETTASRVHRAALQSPAAVHTALTNRFSGRPARSIVNRVIRELGPIGEVSPFPLAATAIGPLRSAAEANGLGDFSPLWSGQNASGCRAIPAAQMTRALAAKL